MASGEQLLLGCGIMMLVVGAVIVIAALSSSQSLSHGATAVTVPSLAPTGNKASDRLARLPASARAEMLGKIVNDDCSGTQAFYMGTSPGDHQAFWSVRCADGRSYQAAIEANATGSAQVMDCGALKAIADLDCFVRLEDRAHREPRTKKQIRADIDKLPPRVRRKMEESLKRAIGKQAVAAAWPGTRS